MKRVKQIMAFIFILVLVVGISPFTVDAASKLEPPALIRVGYTDSDLSFVEDNGRKRGYLFDYLNELERYGDFKYEFIKANHSKQEELLKNRQLDLILFEKKERADLNGFEISSVPWSNIKGVLCVFDINKNKKDYEYEDFKSFEGLKVGYLENSGDLAYFKDYEDKNNFRTKVVPFKNMQDIKEAFMNGDINACFVRIMPQNMNFEVIGEINTPIDFAASYKDSEVLKKIDIAMRKLAFYEPKKLNELFEKYFPKQTMPKFTKNEKELIAKNEKIVIAIRQGKRPIVYLKDGVRRGVVPEIIEKIGKTSGLNFEYKIFGRAITDEEIEKDKSVDFLVVNKETQESKEFSKDSISFFEDSLVVAIRKHAVIDSGKPIKIGFVKIFNKYRDGFDQLWNNKEFIEFTTNREVLDAVNDKNVEAGLFLKSRGRYLLKSPYYKDVMLSGLKNQKIALALKANDINSRKYLSIINKSIKMLKANKEINILVTNIEAEPYDLSSAEFVYEHIIAISLITLLILLLIALYIREERQNDILNEANKKSKAASVAKSEFLANMSHELRTPLNAIIGLNYLLKDSLTNYKLASDYVEKIKESSKMLLSIINDILDMSAIESGKLTLANEKFNIKESIYAVTELYYGQCVEKGILYESDASGIEHEILVGDSYRLRQVVINVLSNAVKFTERGGKINLDLIEEKISAKKSILKIIVRDTGCGMSEEFKKRLFGEFEQEDATTVRNHGGSGLGLAICKRLVHLMKGHISVDSTLGKGSTFTVEVPFEVGEKLQFNAVSEISKLDVLIVDDNIKTCEYISSILNIWNIKSEYVTSSSSAIKKVEDRILAGNEYNFYIIDMKMPKMNGVELSKKLKAIVNKDAIMMIISDYDITEFRENDEECGTDCFLRKPIFPSELFNTIITKLSSSGKLSASSKFESKVTLENMKILLVEDNRINELIARKLLEKVGALVTVAKNGQEALDLIKTNKEEFDVVLMDIQMPVMNGYEATKKIRAINSSYTKKLPIYAMTANSFQADIENSLKNGMDGHISKPIEPEALFKILSALKKS